MTRTITFFVGAAVLVFATAALIAHEETYKGTVMAVASANVQVKVIDDTTKKEVPMTFGINPTTKLFRGDKAVSFANAHIQKDERIAVTIDHDVPGHNATEIRLAAQK